MPHIINPTISGENLLGQVEIKDQDSDLMAEVTQAGLAVDINDPIKVGHSTYVVIDATERRLDTTSLIDGNGYPLEVEIEAQYAPCHIYQGTSLVTLPAGHLTRIRADEWRLVTISGVTEAYFAVKRESSSTASGLLVATRIDRIGL